VGAAVPVADPEVIELKRDAAGCLSLALVESDSPDVA
jgi:hypothetical protein